MKLQRRVTRALVGSVALFLAMQGVIAYLLVAEQEDDLVDELLRSEARQLAARVDRGEIDRERAVDLLASRPNLSAWLVDASGQGVPSAPPPRLRGLGDGLHQLAGLDEELHVAVLPTRRGRLIVQYDARQHETQVRRFGLFVAALGVLCLGLAFAVSRSIARLVVEPIERVAARLAAWAPDAGAPAAEAPDEESRLLEAFRRVQERFERAVAGEREFVANLSHEIRTPLTALRTDLEMLELAAEPPAARRARTARAMAAVDAIADALQAARALSRHRSEPEGVRPIDLAGCVDDAWMSLGSLAVTSGVRFLNEVPPGSEVVADRHALLTILRNLLRNAVEHAAPARCVVRRTSSGLEIEDDGRGIAAEERPFVFERYWRGRRADSPGAAPAGDRGLGLAIARQIADLQGWRLAIDAAAVRGTRFRLDLEARPDAGFG